MKYLLSILCLFVLSCPEQQVEEVVERYEDGQVELEKNEQWCNEHKTYHDVSKEKYPCLKPKPY